MQVSKFWPTKIDSSNPLIVEAVSEGLNRMNLLDAEKNEWRDDYSYDDLLERAYDMVRGNYWIYNDGRWIYHDSRREIIDELLGYDSEYSKTGD